MKDLELAKALARTGSLFLEDLSKAKKFSENAYGSVPRIFVVCDQDKAITEEFQRWMIENGCVSNVVEIRGSDHMPMFSKPKETYVCLVELASKYA